MTRENIPTLTRDAPLDGYDPGLLVDYEYMPNGFDAGDVTGGFRGKHWFGDHVARRRDLCRREPRRRRLHHQAART